MAIDRRKRPLTRANGELRDASLFVVGVEGEKTEPLYFSLFASPKLKIIPLSPENGRSSPESVLDRISKYKSKYEFDEGDTFWIVIDRDRWTIKSLALVHAQCKAKRMGICVSNPCFEIWIALHYAQPLPEKHAYPVNSHTYYM